MLQVAQQYLAGLVTHLRKFDELRGSRHQQLGERVGEHFGRHRVRVRRPPSFRAPAAGLTFVRPAGNAAALNRNVIELSHCSSIVIFLTSIRIMFDHETSVIPMTDSEHRGEYAWIGTVDAPSAVM